MARGQLKVPLTVHPGGIRQDVNPIAVPDGYILDGTNWLTRSGRGKTRPGYIKLTQTAAADRIIGIGYRGSPLAGNNVVVHSLTKAYSYDGSSLSDITGTWTASTAQQQVRFVNFVQSGTTYIVRANDVNAPDEWNGAGAFTDVAGTPPTFRDMMVLGGRILGVRAAANDYRVQWSGFNDRTVWSSTATAELRDTPGVIAACRPFGPNTGAIYKDDAVYLASVQAALQPFQFQLVSYTPGPVSAGALTVLNGIHYWLAEDGNIYAFDGHSIPQPVGGGLISTLHTFLSIEERKRSFAFPIHGIEPEVWFNYPRNGAVTTTDVASVHDSDKSLYKHTWTHEISAASEWNTVSDLTIDGLDSFSATIDGLDTYFATIDAMTSAGTRVALFGDVNGNLYRFGNSYTDNGTEIVWDFTHGYKAIAGIENQFYLDGLLSYWKKTSESITITATIGTTSFADDTDTEQSGTFDTSTASNHLLTFPNTYGKWVKVKHAGSKSRSDLEHRASAIMGWRKAMR